MILATKVYDTTYATSLGAAHWLATCSGKPRAFMAWNWCCQPASGSTVSAKVVLLSKLL